MYTGERLAKHVFAVTLGHGIDGFDQRNAGLKKGSQFLHDQRLLLRPDLSLPDDPALLRAGILGREARRGEGLLLEQREGLPFGIGADEAGHHLALGIDRLVLEFHQSSPPPSPVTRSTSSTLVLP